MKRVLKTVMVLALIGILVCMGILIRHEYQVLKGQKLYENMVQEYVQEPVQEESVTEADVEQYVSPIDFSSLQEKENKDIYAWIKINNTRIDYPVLQHPEDDSYYLVHTVDDTYGYPGSIYTEKLNTKTFEDPVTVLLGHYMKDGSMFTGLHQFMDRDFFDENDEVIIYLPDREIHYQIFAAVHTDNRRILVWNHFDYEENLKSYLEQVMATPESKEDHIREGVELPTDGHYIIMQTCVDESADLRYMVMAVEKSFQEE